MGECNTNTPLITIGSDNPLSQLHYTVVGELEKVNCQLVQLLDTLETPASQMQPSCNIFGNWQQPASHPAPWIEHIPKFIIHKAPPPAPNPEKDTVLPCIVPGFPLK